MENAPPNHQSSYRHSMDSASPLISSSEPETVPQHCDLIPFQTLPFNGFSNALIRSFYQGLNFNPMRFKAAGESNQMPRNSFDLHSIQQFNIDLQRSALCHLQHLTASGAFSDPTFNKLLNPSTVFPRIAYNDHPGTFYGQFRTPCIRALH